MTGAPWSGGNRGKYLNISCIHAQQDTADWQQQQSRYLNQLHCKRRGDSDKKEVTKTVKMVVVMAAFHFPILESSSVGDMEFNATIIRWVLMRCGSTTLENAFLAAESGMTQLRRKFLINPRSSSSISNKGWGLLLSWEKWATELGYPRWFRWSETKWAMQFQLELSDKQIINSDILPSIVPAASASVVSVVAALSIAVMDSADCRP